MTSRKAHGVYKKLQERILIGDLTSESPITEQALAEEFGCAQSTIREALLRLQEDGLVDRRGYQGTFVTHSGNDEILVMIRLRMEIEAVAVQRFLEGYTPEQITDLRAKADTYNVRRRDRDRLGVSDADVDFHLTLLEAAGMPLLGPTLRRTLLHLHRFIVSQHRDNLVWVDKIEASHEAILDAVERRDAPLANRLILQHGTTNTIEVKSEIYRTVFSRLKGVPLGWTG